MAQTKEYDNSKIVFFTPNQLDAMDIGFNLSNFNEDELDNLFPFLVDALEDMVVATTLGKDEKEPINLPLVEGSDGKIGICVCLDVGGKLVKLTSEEWDIFCPLKPIRKGTQIALFQRLVSTGQLTLQDLARADISNDVYKKLVINDLIAEELYEDKVKTIYDVYEKQSKDPVFIKRREQVLRS